MSERIISLGTVPFEIIHHTHLLAFADYAVRSVNLTETDFYNRTVKNGVDFRISAGAFDKNELVGYLLVGLAEWQGQPAAFDIVTGIVPAHRGEGLAGRMFGQVCADLHRRGIKLFLLEVLQNNNPAIRAYEKTGFRIVRAMDSYKLNLRSFKPRTVAKWLIKPVDRSRLAEFESEIDWLPSWENNFTALRRIPDQLLLLGAYDQEQLAGLIAYYPTLKWIMTLIVKRSFRRLGIASALLQRLLSDLPLDQKEVKIVNIPPEEEYLTALIKKTGFEFFLNQYEMELAL